MREGRTDRRADGVKPIYPITTSLIKNNQQECIRLSNWISSWCTGLWMNHLPPVWLSICLFMFLNVSWCVICYRGEGFLILISYLHAYFLSKCLFTRVARAHKRQVVIAYPGGSYGLPGYRTAFPFFGTRVVPPGYRSRVCVRRDMFCNITFLSGAFKHFWASSTKLTGIAWRTP